MKTKLLTLFIGLCFYVTVSGQIKIGDNPQTIDGTSLLELESGTRALVVTRINTAQMNAMAPLQGAVVYNTDTQCLHYYSGTGWINICEALGQSRTFTANAVVNPFPTIIITETTNNLNFEVGQITGDNIVDGTINGANDIQTGSVTQANLALNSVGRDQLVDNAITPSEIDLTVVTLSTFTNDAGFISGPIVSTDGPNSITPGTDGGAFYDDNALQSAISTNTANIATNTAAIAGNTTAIAAHIAADGDLDATNELQNLQQVLTIGNAANNSITNLTNPVAAQDAATKFYVDNAITGAAPTVVSGDVPNSIISGTDGGALYADPDDDTTNELTDLAFDTSTNILNLTNPATAGNSVNLSSLAITGTPNALFFADSPGGAPRTNNTNSLFWDPTARFGTGALFVGVDGFPQSTIPKVHIQESGNGILRYPLQIQNRAGGDTNGSSVGMLFAVEGLNAFGKGSLTYERKAAWGRGDFHFLQNTSADNTNPALANAVMTIKNDGNVIIAPDSRNLSPVPTQKLHVEGTMRLTGNFFDETNAAGTPGQILSSTGVGNGTAWINAPLNVDTDDQTLTISGNELSISEGNTVTLPVASIDAILSTIGVTGTGTLTAPYVLTAGGTTEVADGITITGSGAPGDGFKIEPSTIPGQFLRTDPVTGIVIWDDLPTGTGGAVMSDGITIVGDGVASDLAVPTGGISTTQILDGTIGANDLAVDAVTTPKIADANVTETKIAPGAADQILRTNAAGTLVQWVDLPISGGTTELADQTTISGDGTLGNEFQVADNGIATIKIQANAVTTTKIADANVTPIKIEPGTIGQVLGTDAAGDVAWLTPLPVGTTELADQITITGTGALGNEFEVADNGISAIKIQDDAVTTLKIADDAVTTTKIVDANVTPEKLAPGTEGQFLSTIGGVVDWTTVTPGSITGTENSIFFADTNGSPINAEDAFPQNSGGLFWNPVSRFQSGALFVGLKKGVPSETDSPVSNDAKVVIAERNPGALMYPLKIVNEVSNESPNGSAVGLLFSTELLNSHGKGALAYERNVVGAPGNFARGDFHFLQNSVATATSPTLVDAVMTIKNNGNVIIAPNSRNLSPQPPQKLYVGGDMRLTGSFFDSSAIPSPGVAGQILSSTVTGTEWINAPTGSGNNTAFLVNGANLEIIDANGTLSVPLNQIDTDDQNAVAVPVAATPTNYTAATPDVEAHLAGIDLALATAGGTNLSKNNLTQNADLVRTYEITNATQSLIFSGAGNVGIGNFGGANPALSTDKLDVNGQIRARQGFAANGGTVGQPSFGFHTGGDSDTGLYRPAADEIGFSVGGVEAMRVDEFTTGSTQILVQERLGIGFNLPPDANYSDLDVNSTLQVAGSFATAIFATSGNLTLNDTHHTIILGGNHNITLLAAGSFTGRIYIIKNTTGFTPTITSYIDSFGTPTMTIPAGVIHLQSDGSNWQQIN